MHRSATLLVAAIAVLAGCMDGKQGPDGTPLGSTASSTHGTGTPTGPTIPPHPEFRFYTCSCPPGSTCAPCPPVQCMVLTTPPEEQVTADGHWNTGRLAAGEEAQAWFVVGRSGEAPGDPSAGDPLPGDPLPGEL
ncbi:MAG: hypothetical protein ABR562_08080 [Thermoplasmatota archaeon]